ncbi:DNA polymerase epsilon catalytic subunit A, partial [Trichinella patagoniensis]
MGKLSNNRKSQITCQQVKQNNSNVNVAKAENNCYTSVANNQFSKRTVILHAEFILLSNRASNTSSTFWSKYTSVRIRLSQTLWRGLTKVAVTDNFRKQIPLNDLFQPMQDNEDEEAGKALATKKALQASKGGKKNVKSVTDEILGELTSAQKKNYVLSWLYGLRKRWLHMHRQSRKRPHEMIESDMITSQATGPTHRVDQMLLASPRNLLTRPWNIIQILKNKEPGLFTLWVSIGSELHNVRLRAPRIFY